MWIIDRFEGEYAICEGEGRKMEKILRDDLPPNACEGDILYRNGGWQIDREATEKRRLENAARLRSLRKSRP